MNKYLIYSFLLFLTLICPVSAQESKIILNPSALEFIISPGQISVGQSVVVNQTAQNMRFKIEPMDFKVIDEKGNIEFFFKNEGSAASWLVPQLIEFSVPANSSKEIKFIVQAPEDAPVGDHYTALVFKTVNNGIQLTNDLAALTLITVSGDGLKKQGKLVEFNSPLFHQSGPIDFSVRFRNNGNMHFSPEMKLSVFNSNNELISSASLKQQIVYAQTTREYTGNWQPPKDNFAVYKAKLTVISAKAENANIEKTITIIVFPWKKFIYILAIVAAFILGYHYKKVKNIYNKYFRNRKEVNN